MQVVGPQRVAKVAAARRTTMKTVLFSARRGQKTAEVSNGDEW